MARNSLTKSFPLIVVALALPCAPLAAQQDHPNVATGIKAGNLYTSTGEDNINVFSGNLTYRIPIGAPLVAGPNLKLSATLAYNSSIWTTWQVETYAPGSGNFVTVARPHLSGDRIFGTGWQLHFGRLFPGGPKEIFQTRVRPQGMTMPNVVQSESGARQRTFWFFQEPDGTTHEFYDRLPEIGPAPAANCSDIPYRQANPGVHCFWYSHDGTFLRLDPRDPDYQSLPIVYFPDGTIYVMGHQGGRYPIDSTSFPDDDLDYSYYRATTAGTSSLVKGPFDTTRIVDPFGNAIAVQYYGDPANGTVPAAPAHPLDAYPAVAANEKESIPYRAYLEARPPATSSPCSGPSIELTTEVDTEVRTLKTYYIPRVTAIKVPVYTTGSATSFQCASYGLGYDFSFFEADGSNHIMPVQRLTSLTLPNSQQYAMTYVPAPTNGVPSAGAWARLDSVTLPTLGRIDYTYGGAGFFIQQPEMCPGGCANFVPEPGIGIAARTTNRTVNGSSQQATTTYVRSYPGTPCDITHVANCQLRVDVWEPASTVDSAQSIRVMRSQFSEVSTIGKAAKYGRPLTTFEYFIPPSTPASGTIDGVTPFRTTTFTYGADVDDSVGVGVLGTDFDHNTREISRVVEMAGRTLTTEHVEGSVDSWDGYGHLGLTRIKEFDSITTRTLREVRECHLTGNANTASGCPASTSASTSWILDPVKSRTVSRPTQTGDPTNANLSTTEAFSVNTSTGFVQSRVVTGDDSSDKRTLTTSWTVGNASSAACLSSGTSVAECGNVGFSIQETTHLAGDRLETSDSKSYVRNFYYKYGTLAASYDSNTTFYVADRDVAITSQILGERDSAGRTSLTDTSPQLTTAYEYDLLGRVTKKTPPSEGAENYTYGTQTLTTAKHDILGVQQSSNRVFFDQLGRPIVQLRQMPGTSFSYRVTTYDNTGRRVALSEWQPLTCASGIDSCTLAADLQSTVTGGASPTTSILGSVSSSFEALGRPRYTTLADGALINNTYTGWVLQATSTAVNQLTPTNVDYRTYRDGLGRVTSLVEPQAMKTDNFVTWTLENPQETTTYTYDHFDRLIQSSKPGSDSNGLNSVTQVRTRQYDDFGWLVSEQTPEVPNHEIRVRDGRGNVVVECTGPTATCGSSPSESFAQDRLQHWYDAAGRLVSSARVTDPILTRTTNDPSHPANSFEDYYYDSLSAYGLDYGKSNGRPILAVRQNLAWTNNPNPTNLGTDFGWFATLDLFHYRGLGGRMNFRQNDAFLVDGSPGAPLIRMTLAGGKPASFRNSLLGFFYKQNKKVKHHLDAMATAVTAIPNADAEPVRLSGRTALSALQPGGWFRWSYQYDSAGRLSVTTYPRRDEGFATTISNAYDGGWLTSETAQVRDPFYGPVGTAVGSYSYNPSGSLYRTIVQFNTSEVFRLITPDWVGMPRPSAWLLYMGPSQAGADFYGISYDGSGNVTVSGASVGFTYDARSRLVRDGYEGGTYRWYDGFGNMTRVRSASQYTAFAVDPYTNRHTSTGSGAYANYDANRGNLIYDSAGHVGRDFYPDGREMSQYSRIAPAYDTQQPGGISIFLMNAAGERTTGFWGTDGNCYGELFRYTLRDEGGRIFTDYKAEPLHYFPCDGPADRAVRYQKDYIRFGSYAQVTYQRGVGMRFATLDQLGSPRHTLNAAGVPIGIDVLGSFGGELAGGTNGMSTERHQFTGQERDHIAGGDDGTLPLEDNMHARGYSPALSRFVSPDVKNSFSLFNPQEMNRYAYVMNNPATYIDPFGMKPVGYSADETVTAQDPLMEGFNRFLYWSILGSIRFASQGIGAGSGAGFGGFAPPALLSAAEGEADDGGADDSDSSEMSPLEDTLAGLNIPGLEGLSNYSAGFGDWVSFGLTKYARPDNVVNAASGAYKAGTATGVVWDVATLGAAGARAAGWQTRLMVHGAHHPFRVFGKLSHIQLNAYRAGVKGSGRTIFRIPLPWR